MIIKQNDTVIMKRKITNGPSKEFWNHCFQRFLKVNGKTQISDYYEILLKVEAC